MRYLFTLALAAMGAAAVSAQNCGPNYGGQICASGRCCSQYGWCDTSAAHCNAATCLRAYSGAGSSCAGTTLTTVTNPTTPTPPPSTGTSYPANIPIIDTCGAGVGISCPGAGANGWYYRCCSGNGHCGPKNGEQNQADYCGGGCQAGYGKCGIEPKPAEPPAPRPVSTNGQCGPIINRRCPDGQCCSGSNYCGTGPDFCGAANWCQIGWGTCNR